MKYYYFSGEKKIYCIILGSTGAMLMGNFQALGVENSI